MLWLFLFLMLIIGCDGDGGRRDADKLVITGSSTLAPLIADIGKRYESLHPDVRVDVQTGGSSRGLADVRQGLADIGMMSRSLAATEQDVDSIAVARDGIGLIVHQSNPVMALENEQVAAIYTGKIRHWQEVGGRDAPITVVNKAEGRGTLAMFLKYFGLHNVEIQAQVVVGDNEQGIKTVVGNPNAIAYVSIGTAEYDVTHGVPIKLLSLAGVPASLANLQNGAYPLSRSLLFVTKPPLTALAEDFIQFVRSEDVHDLLAQHYVVPLSN